LPKRFRVVFVVRRLHRHQVQFRLLDLFGLLVVDPVIVVEVLIDLVHPMGRVFELGVLDVVLGCLRLRTHPRHSEDADRDDAGNHRTVAPVHCFP
jgi:hypothetical protein